MDDDLKPASPLVAQELPKRGERALVVGQTGQGKTEFVCWLLERLESSPIVIYDTKGEPKFDALPRSAVVHSEAALREALARPDVDYVIFRVSPHYLADPSLMDGLLWRHFHELRGSDVYIDELYSFTRSGRAGEGLLSLLTQGRSHGFTTLMSVQRPKEISMYPLTESQRFYIFFLADERDRERLGEVIPNFADEPPPPEFHFYYYRQGSRERARLVAPILLDEKKPDEYKQSTNRQATDDPDEGTALTWL